MKSQYIANNTIQELQNKLIEFEKDTTVKSILFLMADDSSYSNSELKPLFKQFSKPIIGGIFPELIYEGKRKNKGVIILPLDIKLNTQLFNLNQNSNNILDLLAEKQTDAFNSSSVLFAFADSLNENKDKFIEALFNYFGINCTYIGGGAGSLNFKTIPCIINNTGIYKNAAVIGWGNKKVALGVAHGWKSISDALKVTKTYKNHIETINWEPAFEVYRTIVEAHSKRKFNTNNFFDIAKSYPLGITKIDAEMVVRDPFKIDGSTIHVVDPISEGEYINILHGDLNSLLDGARTAKKLAFKELSLEMDKESVFCIDCISRVLFMQEEFQQELNIVGEGVNVTGILTLGEIANAKESILEIYNKTIVLSLW